MFFFFLRLNSFTTWAFWANSIAHQFPYLPNGDSEIYLSGLQSKHLVNDLSGLPDRKGGLVQSKEGLALLPIACGFSPPLEGPSGKSPAPFWSGASFIVFLLSVVILLRCQLLQSPPCPP